MSTKPKLENMSPQEIVDHVHKIWESRHVPKLSSDEVVAIETILASDRLTFHELHFGTTKGEKIKKYKSDLRATANAHLDNFI